jgi:endonuclease III
VLRKMRAASPLRRRATERLAHIDAVLQAAYGTPEAELGNKPDPLDEAIYIILSFQTDLARFSSTWSRLRAAYPTWDAVERAAARDIACVLRQGGLHRQKARTIRRLLADVRQVTGGLSLDVVRTMNDEDAERLLTRLPGLSWKAARCVLLYSLGRDVLPIDGNTFRILKRTGVLSRRAVYRRRTLHDAIQAAVPPFRRRVLHVNLVVHGQRTCLPRDPQCHRCPLFVDCPKVDLPAAARRRWQMFHATPVKPVTAAPGDSTRP